MNHAVVAVLNINVDGVDVIPHVDQGHDPVLEQAQGAAAVVAQLLLAQDVGYGAEHRRLIQRQDEGVHFLLDVVHAGFQLAEHAALLDGGFLGDAADGEKLPKERTEQQRQQNQPDVAHKALAEEPLAGVAHEDTSSPLR